MIDFGVSTWREGRKGQKRKRVRRKGRGWGEKEGDEKRGSVGVKRRRERWKMRKGA